MYFVRVLPAPGADGAVTGVDVEKTVDNDLIFGELSSDALATLEAQMTLLFKPSFEKRGEWGKAPKSAVSDFSEECGRFTAHISEALRSMASGIELAKPDKRYDVESTTKPLAQRAKEDADMLLHFEVLLEGWCSQIEKYLEDRDPAAAAPTDAGPMHILEYWRGRMQRLTSITEQLKTKEIKAVLGVLTGLAKNPDSGRASLLALLRRWKQIDIQITEAANEAKDNVKYLFTLEKFIEPLYNGTPATIQDTLPALMNSIKMIHTIARYFNTTERMTDLFVKITNQMIANCKGFVLAVQAEETGDKLWKKDPQQLVVRLEACLKLNEAYQENYKLTKDKLLATPKVRRRRAGFVRAW